MNPSHRSARSLRQMLSLAAALAMLIALVPAGFASADSRSTDDVCPPPGESESNEFPDDDGTIHEDNIDCAAQYDIVQGFEDGTFRPNADSTRQQMATFIVDMVETALGEELPEGGNHFDDDDDSVHHDNINKLAEAGIVQGRADGDYDPADTVSRAAMATFIANAIDYVDDGAINNSQPPATTEDAFDDDEGSVHEDNINRLAAQDIVSGTGETEDDSDYSPGDDVTRGQLASFVMQAADYLDELNQWAPTQDQRERTFDVTLSWENEVDDDGNFRQGQPDAEGNAEVAVTEDDDCFDFTLDYSEVDGPFDDAPGFHVHEGPIDENGPIVATLLTGAGLQDDADGEGGDQVITEEVCDAEDPDGNAFDVSELIDDPDAYYLNVHSNDYPAGAIRGQFPDGGQDDVPEDGA